MDEAGFETAHLVGNSLGGFVALRARRPRPRPHRHRAGARPAAGPSATRRWPRRSRYFRTTQQLLLEQALPHADAIVATPEGRAQATADVRLDAPSTCQPELILHQMRGAAAAARR